MRDGPTGCEWRADPVRCGDRKAVARGRETDGCEAAGGESVAPSGRPVCEPWGGPVRVRGHGGASSPCGRGSVRSRVVCERTTCAGGVWARIVQPRRGRACHKGHTCVSAGGEEHRAGAGEAQIPELAVRPAVCERTGCVRAGCRRGVEDISRRRKEEGREGGGQVELCVSSRNTYKEEREGKRTCAGCPIRRRRPGARAATATISQPCVAGATWVSG